MKNKILVATTLIVVLFAGCKKEEPEAEPVAKFSYSINDKTVTFTNQSLNAKRYYWTFGDGSATSEANPTKTYSSAGKYTVTLKATNITLTSTYEVTISLSNPTPQAKFTYSTNGLQVTFKNQSTNAQSYSWNFGNGQTSTQKDPTITYGSAGTYSVSLTARNGETTDTYKQNVLVSSPTPQAKFTYSTNGLQVTFKNQSTNAQSYSWNFGNGQTSTQKDPTITYGSAGTYSVSLTARNGETTDTYKQNVSVSYKQPTAGFTYKTEAPLKVVLTNTSTNATSYEWDFGDGTASTEKSPTHKYNAVGSYIITLVAKNPSGSQQYRETIEISAPKVYVKGIRYNWVGQDGKYYRCVCQDDDFFTNTWWNTSYTPMLSETNLPYTETFSSPIEMTGLSGDTYYTVYVYWNTKTSGDGTQILKQKMYTADIKTYSDELGLVSNNGLTCISVIFEYRE